MNFQAIKPNHLRKSKPNYLNQNRLGKSWNQTEPFSKKLNLATFKPN